MLLRIVKLASLILEWPLTWAPLLVFALLNALAVWAVARIDPPAETMSVVADSDWKTSVGIQTRGRSPVEIGSQTFQTMGCVACHSITGEKGNGPSLMGVYGRRQKLENGESVLADESYLRESIAMPLAKRVAGYDAEMPSYSFLTDTDIEALVTYIKSLEGKTP